MLELAKAYGAGVVVGTIDEEGMARTAERKFSIAQRAYRDAVEFGIPAHEIFYDPLALPISTGIEEDRLNGAATIEAIRRIRIDLPGVHVVLGVSNAARLACVTMAAAQIVVIVLLAVWGLTLSAVIVACALAAQAAAMPRLLRDPAKYAPWYNGVGVTLYVLGMLASALGLGGYI